MKHAISLGLALFAVWLLWSGYWPGVSASGVLLTGLGAASCLAVLLIVYRMQSVDHETAPVQLTVRAVLYAPWLLWEIVKANVDVARRILHPAMPIRPSVIRVDTSQRGDVARVIYANSITLTPGTVTIDTAGNRLVVHALTEEAAAGLATGEMDRRVSAIEGRS